MVSRSQNSVPHSGASTSSVVNCKVESLPISVARQLNGFLASWKIQGLDDLSNNAQQTWKGGTPLQCPGITIGQFERSEAVSYAVLVVPRTGSGVGYKLLVLSPKAGTSAYATRVADQSSDGPSSSFFIRKVEVRKFFDARSREKFHVNAPACILLVDSDEAEYESDIYFWAGGKYQHRPVDY